MHKIRNRNREETIELENENNYNEFDKFEHVGDF